MDLPLVRHHVAMSTERLAARIAVVILEAGVRDHVARQVAGRDEGLAADGTHLVTDTGVDFLVRLEVAHGRELFAADLTLKGTLAGVRAHMNRQIVLLGEASRTVGALVRTLASVDANVHLQLGGTLERFVALVAGLRHLWRRFGASFLALLWRFADVSVFTLALSWWTLQYDVPLQLVVVIIFVVITVDRHCAAGIAGSTCTF